MRTGVPVRVGTSRRAIFSDHFLWHRGGFESRDLASYTAISTILSSHPVFAVRVDSIPLPNMTGNFNELVLRLVH